MWSCTCCTALAPGCAAVLLLGLLLGVRGLCAPKLGFRTTGIRVLLPSSPGSSCRAAGPLVVLLLAGSGSRCIRCSSGLTPPSWLSLFALSVSLSGVALAGSALPQSTSSCRSSLSVVCAGLAGPAAVSLVVGCRVPSTSAAAFTLPPLGGSVSSAWVGSAAPPGVALLVAALFARCCLASAFAFALTVEVLPEWLLTACLSLLAFNFRRMRRALASSLWTSCGNRSCSCGFPARRPGGTCRRSSQACPLLSPFGVLLRASVYIVCTPPSLLR